MPIIGRRLEISKPSLAVIKDALKDITTHTTMKSLFEQYGFEIGSEQGISNKLQRASAYLDHQDWSRGEIADAFLSMMAQRFAELGSAVAENSSCQRIIKTLHDFDNIEWDGMRFVRCGSPALHHVAKKSSEFNIDTIEREVQRMLESVETDPDDSITAAKCLVEATCRAILRDFGVNPAPGTELGPLTKQTLSHLKLLPDQISDASRGAESAKKVLHCLGTAIQGLGELRNLYGDAHGKGPDARGLEPRHARLSATFAGALAVFMRETHQCRRPNGKT